MLALQERDYQTWAVDSVFTYFSKKAAEYRTLLDTAMAAGQPAPARPEENPVIALPVGTGKSVVIASFLKRIYHSYPTQRVMMLTHVKELIEQNFDKLLRAWNTAPAGIYSAGLGRRDVYQKIIFAGIASVNGKADLFGHVDLILVDEAHLISPKDATMYRAFISALQTVNPRLRIIGLTATPWRLGHGKITENGGLFTDICFDATGVDAFNWFITEGYLCPLVPRPTTAKIDTDGVHMRGGEFIEKELHARVGDQITAAALQEALAVGGDRKSWLLFCAGTDHARRTAALLNEAGVSCEVVDKDTTSADRRRILADFKSGKLRAVANNNVLTTGFDHPGLDLIVMLRPTASAVLWVQMLGRGTRPLFAPGFNLATKEGRLAAIAASPKQNCLVLDFAGNAPRLGPINDPVVPKRKGEAKGEAPIKVCPQCSTYVHASARHCDFCGFEFPQHGPKLNDTAGTADLIKIDIPKVEVFRVDHVVYSRHEKLGKPPSVRVTYYCGNRAFAEYVCPEHQDTYSPRRARGWFQERRFDPATPVPTTTSELLKVTDKVRVPSHIRVWTNKQHPEITSFCFDGTAFQTAEANAAHEVTTAVEDHGAGPVQADGGFTFAAAPRKQSQKQVTPPSSKWDDMDDDIPF